jgi:hypothetical protein
MARGGKREGAGRKKGCKDTRPRSSPVIIAPAQEKRELREAAREFTDDALKTLAEICKDGQSESARVAAANCLLDRSYGKPMQQVENGSPGEFSRMTDEELARSILEQTKEIAKLDPEFANEIMLPNGRATAKRSTRDRQR